MIWICEHRRWASAPAPDPPRVHGARCLHRLGPSPGSMRWRAAACGATVHVLAAHHPLSLQPTKSRLYLAPSWPSDDTWYSRPRATARGLGHRFFPYSIPAGCPCTTVRPSDLPSPFTRMRSSRCHAAHTRSSRELYDVVDTIRHLAPREQMAAVTAGLGGPGSALRGVGPRQRTARPGARRIGRGATAP